MSGLHQEVSDYVQLRRALGYQLRGYDRYLADLVSDVERSGARALTIEAMVAWACKPAEAPPVRWKMRLGIARGFARYMQTIDPANQVPPLGLLAFRRSRPAPYLYSPAEIRALLDATDTLQPPLRAATYRTLIGLLAVTGMRVGEALALDDTDVDLPNRATDDPPRKGRQPPVSAAPRDRAGARRLRARSPAAVPGAQAAELLCLEARHARDLPVRL